MPPNRNGRRNTRDYLVDYRGGRREDAACRPVTCERLRGALQAEVGRLQERVPTGPSQGRTSNSFAAAYKKRCVLAKANSPNTGLESLF